ncbi:MAG: hypothetical protein OK455_06160, partial [Thaumarchaeota archaeon]|nr:hypothetical protein [Nitrososphaerota archaeon]
AVSDPRAYSISLGTATSTSTTSTTSSATSTRSSATSSASTSHEETRTSTTSPATTTTTEPSQSSRSNEIEFTPVKTSTAPKGYGYGVGGGEYAITGGSAYFSLDFSGQNPNTHYLIVLSVNGTARTIGNYTTNGEGVGKLGASTTLGAGTFVLGLTVVDSSSFSTPTLVLASVPSSFIVNIHATSTTTSTTASTTSTTATSESTPRGEGPSWEFKLVSVPVTNATAGYRFATSGTAVVSLAARYSLLEVELGFQDGNPSTAYKVALSLNGTIVDVGAMTTNKDGGAVLQAEIQVNPGRYMLGVLVYDISTFKNSGPVLVMVSDPNTQLASIASSTLGTSSSSSSSSSTSQGSTQATTTLTTTAKTIDAGTDVENEIEHAVNNLTIPATIEVTPLSSSTTVLDSRFSISVGQQVGNGLIVAISGTNVTGPRVLLINMSRTSPLALYPALNVTLDGIPVVEASSSLQVLNPVAGDPARYVLVATSTSVQLLVSIPHFSLHLIQVAGVIVQAIQTSLVLDAPLLAGSVLVITLAFAVAYAARKRVSTVLL